MRVNKALFGQAIRFIDVIREEKKDYSLFKMNRAIQTRYEFLEAPTKLQDYNYNSGVTYQVGRFGGKGIKRFQIYQPGLLCEAEDSTDVCDAFLDDITGWLEREFEQRGHEKPLTRAYVSQVEVYSDIDLGAAFQEMHVIGRSLQENLRLYSPASPQFEVSSIRMQIAPPDDPQALIPAQFIFERRADSPFSDNLYFSSAPVRTADHVKILDELEGVLAKR